MRLWNRYSPDKEWHRWVDHSSTEEDQLAKVIRRHHREQYAHNTCPFRGCEIHYEPLTDQPLLLASDNRN